MVSVASSKRPVAVFVRAFPRRRLHGVRELPAASDSGRAPASASLGHPHATQRPDNRGACGHRRDRGEDAWRWDLYPHQSTSLLDPLAKDGLLADWDIQHLHLGLPGGRPTIAPFVNRSQKVLLVRFTPADAYLIDCPAHGPDVQAPWWDTDLPETLHRNWPESIAHLRLNVSGGSRLTWDQHRRMRPVRGFTITTAVTVTDDAVYLLGTGLLASGYSFQAGQCADRIMTRMVEKALAHTDDEKVVIRGDLREVHVYFEPR